MKWIAAGSKHSTLLEYRLMDNETCKVLLKYNPRQQSARLSSGDHQRLFFIESAGSLSGKTIIRNEYGVEVGQLGFDHWYSREGTIQVDNHTFHYKLVNQPSAKLMIYTDNSAEPLASCELSNKGNDTSIHFIDNTPPDSRGYLLLGLCWYLFLPVARENVAEYAA